MTFNVHQLLHISKAVRIFDVAYFKGSADVWSFVALYEDIGQLCGTPDQHPLYFDCNEPGHLHCCSFHTNVQIHS